MQKIIYNIILFLLPLIMLGTYIQLLSQTEKILIVTGGKKFQEQEFYDIFNSFNDIVYDTISKPNAFKLFGDDRINQYKAILFYDTYQPITEEEKKAFLTIFDKGIGCVFLHHSLVSHQEWDEYENILGGRYFHKPYEVDGKKYGPSTYKHDQDFNVIIVDKNHPATKNLEEFKIRDEIYLNYKIHDNVIPLITTDNCETGMYIGWTKVYKNSRIVVNLLGHDEFAYQNAGFRDLLKKTIVFVSNKE